MIDLNGKDYEGTTIFNGGNAGLAQNVTISVNKRQVDEPENRPDYQLVIKDKSGSEISQGFYYFKPKGEDAVYDKKRETQEVSRIVHLARAVMGNDYQFPAVTSPKEAADTLFKIVKENAGNKEFNVFVTYGTAFKPSKYLGVRYFDFIESASGPSHLVAKKSDNMIRLVEDSDDSPINGDKNYELPTETTGGTTPVENWDV